MASDSVRLSVNGDRLDRALREAGESLGSAQGEVVLDFSAVQRIDSGTLQALDDLSDAASGKGIQLVMSNVSVDIYKVLKLTGLTSRFTFRS